MKFSWKNTQIERIDGSCDCCGERGKFIGLPIPITSVVTNTKAAYGGDDYDLSFFSGKRVVKDVRLMSVVDGYETKNTNAMICDECIKGLHKLITSKD